jgi:hypothetical protein
MVGFSYLKLPILLHVYFTKFDKYITPINWAISCLATEYLVWNIVKMRSQTDPESHLPYIEPPSQVGLKAIEIPPPYTGTPWLIFISDVKLFFQNFFYLFYLFLPLYPWRSVSLCEMYPSWDNLTDIALHLLLSIAQLTFLASLFTLAFLPTFTYIGYIAVFLAVNEFICWHFNKGIPSSGLRSTEDAFTRSWPRHDDEAWIFLNGICVG